MTDRLRLLVTLLAALFAGKSRLCRLGLQAFSLLGCLLLTLLPLNAASVGTETATPIKPAPSPPPHKSHKTGNYCRCSLSYEYAQKNSRPSSALFV